ncbi:DUF397 domain-containing protein [Actinacidiphila alni]|uniref:DUF397 domain-containing protein n=1 Tax=Actinacidiphila alni TaxID=380248 RepID=A0A1I2FAN6_9ACTN|nr:DUF397 domain-containing protein [Actinacidiphila alni]SFF01837.1 protein of unknown function [Actinacidiphila alni]
MTAPASLVWQKSTYSQEQGECVELAEDGGAVLLRESDDPTVVLSTTPTALARFLRAIKRGG